MQSRFLSSESTDAAILRDMLRVNHAGEFGAIRIYTAQRWIAACRAPGLIDMIDDALADERRHCEFFRSVMAEREIGPCNLLGLWWLGGAALGLITGLLGRSAILVCTEAVEQAVHGHMAGQIAWLLPREPALADQVAAIQVEELAHLQRSLHIGATRSRLLHRIIGGATHLLVWCSTYGISGRLVRALPEAECEKGRRLAAPPRESGG